MRELVGRAAERRALHDALTSARAGGVRVVLHGEPGIGKTSLLDDLVATARTEGVLALRCVGVPSETHVAYAALHQLLQPLLAGTAPDARTALVRRAVGSVTTRDDPTGPAPEPVAVALATLDLLRERAAATPLLLGVEDVQWLDASSAVVLAFVARRVDDDPVLLVCSSREPLRPPLDDVPFLPVDLAPLDEAAAATLVRRAAPDLHPVLRDRLLREAQGNPLALVELAGAWRRLPDGALVISPVPVTARVEAAFAARVDDLPPPAARCSSSPPSTRATGGRASSSPLRTPSGTTSPTRPPSRPPSTPGSSPSSRTPSPSATPSSAPPSTAGQGPPRAATPTPPWPA